VGGDQLNRRVGRLAQLGLRGQRGGVGEQQAEGRAEVRYLVVSHRMAPSGLGPGRGGREHVR
jgi:hypothetical protein